MTEAEWLCCTAPGTMMEALHGEVSERKLRLFACGCCRRFWPSLPQLPICYEAVEAGERFADGLIAEAERKRLWEAARDFAATPEHWPGGEEGDRDYYAAPAVTVKAHGELFCLPDSGGRLPPEFRSSWPHAEQVACFCAQAMEPKPLLARGRVSTWRKKWRGVKRFFGRYVPLDEDELHAYPHSASLFREIVGNPFRPVAVDGSWLEGQGGAVWHLARGIYDERRFSDLPVLADALEEAGCRDDGLLSHARQPGEHVRGCWLVDLLLGKS